MVDTIIKLSEKYIFDRNRPDKEIDILDEVCSRVSMNESLDESDFKNIKKEINKINKEKIVILSIIILQKPMICVNEKQNSHQC